MRGPCRSKGSTRRGGCAATSRSWRSTSQRGKVLESFLQRHSGERVFWVAPWLSALSGVTMTIARLSRRVWAARNEYIAIPAMTNDQEQLVARLLGPVVIAPNGPRARGRQRVSLLVQEETATESVGSALDEFGQAPQL